MDSNDRGCPDAYVAEGGIEDVVALVHDCANMLGEEPSPELAMMIADYFDLDEFDVEDMLLDGYDF